MGIARSTYYEDPKGSADDTALVEAMHAIKDEFEGYGWRRMQAALRHRGWVVNHKKIRRLMRELAMHPPLRRRFVATTDSDHDEPIFPDRSRDREIDGPNRLWVVDLTYITILGGFVYLAAIMDAWSRRIVGYALGRRIDVLLRPGGDFSGAESVDDRQLHAQRMSLLVGLDGGLKRRLCRCATTALAPASLATEVGIIELDPAGEGKLAVSLHHHLISLCRMRHAAL